MIGNMNDPWQPNRSDPLGFAKADLGTSLVDSVTDTLTVDQCLKLALSKIDTLTASRETSLAVTKIEEAQHWLWANGRIESKT
jgi:hypothetical protein